MRRWTRCGDTDSARCELARQSAGPCPDVGAGTGALAGQLAARGVRVAAAGPSPHFVEAIRARLPEVDAQVAPAEELPWADESFDAALAQLVVSFMRDAPAGVFEMRRVVKPGGTIAVCMWDREGMEMLAAVRRAQQALGPDRPLDVRYRTSEEIESLFGDGFGDSRTELLEVDSSYAGYDEFWAALSGGAGPGGAGVAGLCTAGREGSPRAEAAGRSGGWRAARGGGRPRPPAARVRRSWALAVAAPSAWRLSARVGCRVRRVLAPLPRARRPRERRRRPVAAARAVA